MTGTVLLFDRTDRLRMHFTGPKAGESLTGLVTNHVLALQDGDGQYACALTAKGRIIADVRIFGVRSADGESLEYLVDSGVAAGVGFAAMIRKYVNPRVAKYRDVTGETACLTLRGDGALALLQPLCADPDVLRTLHDAPAYAHRLAAIAGFEVRVARVPDLGEGSTFDLFCDQGSRDALLAALIAAGAAAGSDADWERMRVLAGRPRWGVDMDDGTLAQEANMDGLQAISYQKGCYTGQETVARVHFRGHVNRTLRRVTLALPPLPAAGTPLLDGEGAQVGDVRSVVDAGDGAGVGIAMIRREVGDAAQLVWRDDADGSHSVNVVGAAEG